MANPGATRMTLCLAVNYPDSTVAQLTVGSDGHGGVMLVWRTLAQVRNREPYIIEAIYDNVG